MSVAKVEDSQCSKIEQRDGQSYTQTGNNNQLFAADTINYTEAQRKETPPPPLSTVPFTRDPKFIEREEFGQLQQKLSAGGRVAINGLGGVGKSQLAIEYCHRIREQSPNTWVFWLHASNATRFDQEIISLANDIKLQGRNAKDANIYQLLRNWLNDSRKRWLIILDNADDAQFLFEAPQSGYADSRRRIDYIPICSHGSLLVTSRWKKIAKRIVDVSEIIVLEPEKQHATDLLKSKLINEHTNASVEKLAETLEHIALAISQAAAYINARGARFSVDDYIKRLEKSEKSELSLLTTDFEDIRRETREEKTSNAILLTWMVSFEHIQAIRQSAANLLSLVSFYDHQSIPDYLLHSTATYTPVEDNARSRICDEDHHMNKSGTGEDARSESSVAFDTDEAFEDDLLLLLDFSLISRTLDKSVFQTHRMVQLATQSWLKKQKQHTQFEVNSLVRLDEAYPHVEFQQWERCRSLFSHACRALKSTTQDKDGLLSLDSLLYKASQFAREQGEYVQSEIMAKRSADISASMNGADHPETLKSMSDLAATYLYQGRWFEAEELQVKVLELSKRVMGEEHPTTLLSMSNLALTYRNRGRWLEAEALQVKALELTKRALGEKHPSTLTSMNNLALTYAGNQDRLCEAEALQVEVLDIQERVLGEEHPDTLLSMHNLVCIYQRQEKLQQAQYLITKCTEARGRVLGDEHPDTLTSMHVLVTIYHDQGKLQQAQDLMTESTEVCSRVLGDEHPETLTSMHVLATIYHDQGKLQQAQDLMARCAEARARVLGAAHDCTENSRSWLEYICSARKKIVMEEAESAAESTHRFAQVVLVVNPEGNGHSPRG